MWDYNKRETNLHTITFQRDFNAKAGINATESNQYMGTFRLGTRNERGDNLIIFAEIQKLYIWTHFLKLKEDQGRNQEWNWFYIIHTQEHNKGCKHADLFYFQYVKLKLAVNTN